MIYASDILGAVATRRPGLVDSRFREATQVGIAAPYGMDCSWIESRWGGGVQTGPGARPAPYTMVTGSFPGVKRPGRGFDHPPQLAARLMEEWRYTSTPPPGLRGLF